MTNQPWAIKRRQFNIQHHEKDWPVDGVENEGCLFRPCGRRFRSRICQSFHDLHRNKRSWLRRARSIHVTTCLIRLGNNPVCGPSLPNLASMKLFNISGVMEIRLIWKFNQAVLVFAETKEIRLFRKPILLVGLMGLLPPIPCHSHHGRPLCQREYLIDIFETLKMYKESLYCL